jgi:hypothetical protein
VTSIKQAKARVPVAIASPFRTVRVHGARDRNGCIGYAAEKLERFARASPKLLKFGLPNWDGPWLAR